MEITCQICGLSMKDRLNGSHLKRKHDLTIGDYIHLYGSENLGKYRSGEFECKICGETMSSQTSIKKKHLKDRHDIESVDNYNIEYEKSICKCGCSNVADYSYERHRYNDYIREHVEVWNTGLTKDNHSSLQVISDKNTGRVLGEEHRKIIIEKLRFWESNPDNLKEKHLKTVKAIKAKYGTDNVFRLDRVKKQIKETNIEKYGFESPMQNPDIMDKSFKNMKKYDKYVDVNGNECYLQGFDKYGLKELLLEYDEKNIIIDKKQIPRIKYFHNNKNRIYTPDFYLPGENILVEIKSDYIFNKEYIQNMRKFSFAIKNGYKLRLMIFDNNKNLIVNKIYESKHNRGK